MQVDQVFIVDEDADTAMGQGMEQQMNAGGAGDIQGRALGLIKTADALAMKGQVDEAMGQYYEASGIVNEMKWDQGIAAASNVLTKIYLQQAGPNFDEDDMQTALEQATDSLKLMQKASFKKGEAVALGTFCSVYVAMGRPDKGIQYAKQALAAFQEIGDFRGVASMYMALKDAYLLKGDTLRAAALAKKSAAVYQQLGDKNQEAKAMLMLAKVEVVGNDRSKAESAAMSAKGLFLEAGNTSGMGEAYQVITDMHNEDGKYFEAVKVAKERVTAFHDSGDVHGEAKSLLELGKLFIKNNDNAKAGKVSEVALQMFAGMNDMEGMKAGKELMDGAKQAKLVEDINVTLSSAAEYMHIPKNLIVDPGLNKRIQERYGQAVSAV